MNPKERAKPLVKSIQSVVLGNQNEIIPKTKSIEPSIRRGVNGRFSIGDFIFLFVLGMKVENSSYFQKIQKKTNSANFVL